ncbi:uncharacterized protein LOC129733963 [Wyeomyia smithii]|uniref:uncharacterized protein LOC129733963 n=1 Tax=Wyeomyia smithii TaxID=174621 RepID=UPI002467C714|nr:uncharacterized protein LOC129733963 [Wyeomyia smithii]
MLMNGRVRRCLPNTTMALSLPKRNTSNQQKKELQKALESELKKSSHLSKKLKKVRADNKQLREFQSQLGDDSVVMPRHSTLRDDSAGNQSNSLLMTSMNTLSVASLNLSECKPIENGDDIDRKSFETWKDLLEASMDLIGVTDEVTKMNVFKVKAGLKLLDILDGTPPNPPPPPEHIDCTLFERDEAIERVFRIS